MRSSINLLRRKCSNNTNFKTQVDRNAGWTPWGLNAELETPQERSDEEARAASPGKPTRSGGRLFTLNLKYISQL